jgi:hypothetical protein
MLHSRRVPFDSDERSLPEPRGLPPVAALTIPTQSQSTIPYGAPPKKENRKKTKKAAKELALDRLVSR